LHRDALTCGGLAPGTVPDVQQRMVPGLQSPGTMAMSSGGAEQPVAAAAHDGYADRGDDDLDGELAPLR
jgi:hypothetical protein